MDNLLGRMANDNFRFEFNIFLLGQFPNREITLLTLLSPFIDDRMELGALGRFGGRITEMTKSLAFMSPAMESATFMACSACGEPS